MRYALVTTAAVAAAFFLSACSTVPAEPSPHHGLLDHLARQNSAHREPAAVIEGYRGFLHWPLARMEVTSPFGKRGDEFHEGIDLRARKGTPVFAAQSGRILYASSKIRGYGKMIVIAHADGFTTVYAHNSKLLVQRGARVRQGQIIAISGSSGHSSGPHLHFEVRKGVNVINPLRMLAGVRASSGTLSGTFTR